MKSEDVRSLEGGVWKGSLDRGLWKRSLEEEFRKRSLGNGLDWMGWDGMGGKRHCMLIIT
jgi:hypothetical protein